MGTLNASELERYSRHIILPEFGVDGQVKLKNSRVLVVGSGGLGSPLLLYLAAAGVGHITIVDFDCVEDTNLQRQVLFDGRDIGRPKAEAAAERLRALNPHIHVEARNVRFTSENARALVRDSDVVADGTDNFATRYLVNDACVLEGRPNVYASIYRFEGQISVFNAALPDGSRGPNYRDLFPSPPPPGLVPSCAEGGVLGVLPGILGSLQALEVIKVLTGVGEALVGRLFLFDAATFTSRTLKLRSRADNPLTGQAPQQTELIDYAAFCGAATERPVRELSPQEFTQWRNTGRPHVVIDVREPHEYAVDHLGGILLPLGTVADVSHRIPREVDVVVHCKGGIRSARAIRQLEDLHGFTNLYNLTGGIVAYRSHPVPTPD
ncbi:MAG: molybdopterin-synthase adenylyltransferase MoeB [Flavobacteriales bacterium]